MCIRDRNKAKSYIFRLIILGFGRQCKGERAFESQCSTWYLRGLWCSAPLLVVIALIASSLRANVSFHLISEVFDANNTIITRVFPCRKQEAKQGPAACVIPVLIPINPFVSILFVLNHVKPFSLPNISSPTHENFVLRTISQNKEYRMHSVESMQISKALDLLKMLCNP
eukprot:TRINITY_DN3809_c0_g1_i5.p2 TRINITY_DN3809_c0_g1~~TRINITY_DN3809_c0_g1_i5.p2  ORF type:complete len:170 (+),score=1.48 TRINITY_DN3809_c0_g1_i5:169-678(+)